MSSLDGASSTRCLAIRPLRFEQRQLLFRHFGFVLVVSSNDPLHQMMPHHVAFIEVERMSVPRHLFSMSTASSKPLRRALGRSIWVTSPVITALELIPGE